MTGPSILDGDVVKPKSILDYGVVQPGSPSSLSYLGDFFSQAPKYINMYMATSDNPVANFIGNKVLGLRRSAGISTPSIEDEVRQKVAQARQTEQPSLAIVKNDLSPSNMFSKFNDIFTDQDFSTIDFLKGMVTGLPQMAADLPRMATTPIEAGIGIGLTQPNAPVLNPEERAQKQKEAAGILLSTALGMGSRAALEGYYTSKAAEAVAVAEKGLAPPKLIGATGRKLITGTTEGAVAGTSYGAISKANESDQLSAMLMGLTFAPIGAAFEMLHTSKIEPKMSAADQLFMTRQIQFKPDESSIAGQAKLFEEVASNDDIVKAMASTNTNLGNQHFILQGLTDIQYQDLSGRWTNDYEAIGHGKTINITTDANNNLASATRQYDVLMIHKDSPLFSDHNAKRMFRRSGFIKNEVVSWKGKDYLFDDISGGVIDENSSVDLTDFSGGKDEIGIPLKEIRRSTTFNIDHPQIELQTNKSLKGLWIQAAKNYNPDIFNDTNFKAINSAVHGEPLKIIGFRQQRSPTGAELAIDTGRFYGITSDHVAQYNPYVFKGFTPEEIANGEQGFLWKPSGGNMSNYGKMVSPGKMLGGNVVESLLIHNLTFDKPFIFDGKHKGVWEEIKNGVNNQFSQTGSSIHDKIMSTASTYADYENAAFKEGFIPYSEKSWLSGKQQILSNSSTLSGIAGLMTDQERKSFIAGGDYIYNYSKYAGTKTHPEAGYQIMDRVLKRALTRNGYDAMIFRNKSQFSNTEVISYKLDEIYKKHPATIKAPETNIINNERFVDLLYKDFKNELFSDTNATPYDQLFKNFASARGFEPLQEQPALKLSFEKRLHNEAMSQLSVSEQSIIKDTQRQIAQIKLDNFEKLRVAVHSNGMYFDTGNSGVIKIRDLETNKLLHESQSIEEANNFVNQSGQMKTVDLDGNSPVPPSIINGNIPPEGGSSPFHEGVIPDLPTKAEQFIAHSEPTWLTRNRENFRNLDVIHNLNGAMLRIQDMLDSGKRSKLAQENPFLQRLQVIHKMLEGSADMDKKIPIWMQMRTPQEIISSGARGGRAMNPDEINLARTLAGSAGNHNDIDKLYKVIEFRRKLQKDGLNGKMLSAPERKVQYEQYKQQLGFTPQEDTALQALLMARRLPLDQLETGAAVRLAEALQAKEKGFIVDRNEFASKNFNPKQLAAAKLSEQLYKDLADRFGIDQNTLLQGYFPHARTKFDGNLSRTLNEFKVGPKEKDFFSRMVRTGEIRAYDDGLTAATQRYISAGFNELYMKKNVADAIDSFKNDVLPKITDPARRKNAIAIFNSYKDSLMGKPHHLDVVANESFKSMLQTLGIPVEKDSKILQNLVNGAMMTITSATQGLRPVMALRDFYSNMRTYGIKMLSMQKAAEVIKYGFSLEDSAVREALMSSGEVQHYGILQFGGIETESAIRDMASRLGRKLSDAETAMIKYGGQPTIYERITAGITIERKKAVMEGARQYLADGQTKESLQKIYKDLRLDSYDHSVQQNFNQLFQSGKYEDASKFLARQTVAETTGWYGQGNHPKGWNTYLGRVAGQFGNWSLNYRDTVLRSVATGPMKDRLTRLAIMAAFDGGLTLAGAKIGLSFHNWMTLPAMTFMGGPSLDYIQAVNNSIFGFGQDKQVAQSKMKRLLPYDSLKDEWHLNQFYLPGGYFANDIAKAMEVADDMGTNWGVLQGAGFRVEDAYYKPGIVENYMKQNVVDPINY